MFRVGQSEIDAIAAVIHSGKLFRYQEGGQCHQFEQRYAQYLDVGHVTLCASGSLALTAALAGVGIGPGDEVVVPAHTYMATAISVLAVGAIPIIVDVDESITLCPRSLRAAIGPRTRAVIPVHMWGLACDMDAIMAVARERQLRVIEDACQMVGGGYRGRKAGSIGDAGAFSFNYFKNLTCGEGGAVVTSDERIAQRVKCMVDCCGYFWTGKVQDVEPFAASGARASEIEGAMMNAQLDRIEGIVTRLRQNKKRILAGVADSGLRPAPAHSLESECGTHVVLQAPTATAALTIAQASGGVVASRTGRHTYTEWHPVLQKRGAHHPALDPFRLPQNQACRMEYHRDQCRRSLEILERTILWGQHPDWDEQRLDAMIATINAAAATAR